MKIQQLSIFLQNRMGSLSKPLEVLSDADVNIRAMCMADTSEFGILRLVVDNPLKGKEALEEKNFLVKITDIIGVEMNDTIDLEYLYAFSHEDGEKAILLLHAEDIDNLISILNDNDIVVVPSEEVYNL